MTRPPSFAEERIWLAAQTQSTAFNTASGVIVDRDVSSEYLQGAARALITQHDVLRATYRHEGGRLEVHSVGMLAPTIHDLGTVGDALDSPATAALVRPMLIGPFDTAAGPLWRIVVARRDGRSLVVVAAHHLIFDGLSRNLVLAGLLLGANDGAAPVPASYEAYARQQRVLARSGAWDRDVAADLARLAAVESALPPPGQGRTTTSGRRAEVVLPTTTLDALRTNVGIMNCTVFHAVLAALGAAIGRYSTAELWPIACTLSDRRNSSKYDATVGCFVGLLVTTARNAPNASMRDLIVRARNEVMAAMPTSGRPSEVVLDALAPADRRLVTGDVLLDHQVPGEHNTGDYTPWMDDMALVPKARLEVLSWESGSGLTIQLMARDDLPAAWLAGVATSMQRFLEGLAEGVDAPVDLITAPEESADDVAAATGPSVPLDRRSLLEQFLAQARATPDRTAVIDDEGGVMSYGDVERHAAAVAAGLVESGVRPADVIGVLAPRSAAAVVGLYGIWWAGAVYLPLDPELPERYLAEMCRVAGVARVLASPECVDLGAALGPTVHALGATVPASTVLGDPPVTSLSRDRDVAYVIFTSGSSGTPKGAMVEHRSIQNRIEWMQRDLTIEPSDVILHKTPLGFDVSMWELLLPLVSGATMALVGPGRHRDPAHLTGFMASAGVTVAHFVPSMLEAALPWIERVPLGPWRAAVASGEVLRPSTAARFARALPHCELSNYYGPTECAVDVTAHRVDGGAEVPVPIGRPIDNATAYVLDRRGDLAPHETPGELALGGLPVGRGYVGDPRRTAAGFRPDPFGTVPGARLYRTGDAARRLDDGVVEFLGRVDGQLKIRGFRTDPTAIEAVLRTHDSVADVAVVGVGAEQPQLAACVVPVKGAALADRELAELVADHLPEHMVPTRFSWLRQLPSTTSGKLDRRALVELLEGATT